MSTIRFTLSNGDTKFSRNLEINKRLNKDLAIGTVLSDFFDLVNLQKQQAVKLFKMNEPFDIKINYARRVIDTAKIPSQLKTKFKLNSTAASKRRFAKNVYAVLEFAMKDTTPVTVEELAAELYAQVEAEKAVKETA